MSIGLDDSPGDASRLMCDMDPGWLAGTEKPLIGWQRAILEVLILNLDGWPGGSWLADSLLAGEFKVCVGW